MITTGRLHKLWKELSVTPGGFRCVSVNHPLEINIGHNEIGEKVLLLVTSNSIPNQPSSKSIQATIFERKDKKWSAAFRLVDPKRTDEFVMLCGDLIATSENASPGKEAECFLGRYRNWQRLLEYQRPDVMDAFKQKGLLGELLYLQRLASQSSPLKALESWLGPEGGDQDFVYDDEWVEVKSIGASASEIQISSLEQLASKQPGKLVVYLIERSTPASSNAISLADKVSEIREFLTNSEPATEKFNAKLFFAGYTNRPEYATVRYNVVARQEFEVTPEFPRLTRPMVPNGVVSVKYNLSLSAIAPYKTSEE